MKKIFEMIFALVCGCLLGLLALYGIDRECARRDYESGQKAVDCIFRQNCDFYNSQRTDFFKG